MMSSCACVRVLALQLLLIFGALLLVRLIDASSCYEQYCKSSLHYSVAIQLLYYTCTYECLTFVAALHIMKMGS